MNSDNPNEDFKNLVRNLEKKDIKKQDGRICLICKSVDSYAHDVSNGHQVCQECGLVGKDIVDLQAECRNYRNADSVSINRNRCGQATDVHLPQSSLGTSISNHIQSKLRRKVANIIRVQNWNAMPYNEKSLWKIFEKINIFCKKNGLSKSVEDESINMYYRISQVTYQKGKNKGKPVITRGDIREAVILACIYQACKKVGEPRSPEEIVNMSDTIKINQFSKGLKKFHKMLFTTEKRKINRSSPIDFVNRYCEDLSIGEFFKYIAEHIIHQACELKIIEESNYKSVAASCITLVNDFYNMKLSKKQIAEKCNITEVTINRTYNKMMPHLKQLLPDEKEIQEIIRKTKGQYVYKVKSKMYECKSMYDL